MRLAMLALVACFGCDGGASIDAGRQDAALDAGFDGGVDAGRAPDICDELGLPRAPFMAATGAAFDEVMGDFTVETLDGTWTLSEAWTGCESYVFLNYANTDYGNGLFATDFDLLMTEGPRNVHYFITSYEADARARVEPLPARLEDAFAFYEFPEEERTFWRSRFHFVVTPLPEVSGSVGTFVASQSTIQHTFAIMRDQRLDPLGSLFEVTGGGFVPRFGMAAYSGHYYNYRAALSERLAAETDATIVPLIDEAAVTARVLDRRATLPADMSSFDTLEIDVEIHCRLDPAGCSEWDRIAYVHLCLDDTCASARELVRWITPYSRPGRMRWVMDASPMLGLMRDGGERLFRITTGPDWEEATAYDITASLRLSDRGGDRARGAELAFRGGTFDAAYDASHPPFLFTPPAGTTKVELVVIVSGHGQTPGDNCAEWCNHEHAFHVNGGTEHRIAFPGEAGQPRGCAARAIDGVLPGQWGNWAPLRAGWCPGFPVAARAFDVTADVVIGSENTLTYDASFMGGEPRGGDIDLSAYVVYY